MEDFEKEIILRHILNKMWIEKAMHLGDPEDRFRIQFRLMS